MGKTHVFGFATALKVFDLPFETIARSSAEGRWLEVTLERTV
jgi:hypothetical protein